jgi:hypothetical protein
MLLCAFTRPKKRKLSVSAEKKSGKLYFTHMNRPKYSKVKTTASNIT